jgi:ribulose kinase
MTKFFLGVDVGTSSVRAGLFDEKGALLGLKTLEIRVFNFKPDHFEHSSDDIWQAVCSCIRELLVSLPVLDVNDIASVGFDATCSLVVLDKEHRPVSVSSSDDPAINVIMWMVSYFFKIRVLIT